MSSRRAAAAAVVSLGAGILGTQSAEAGIVTIDLKNVTGKDFTGQNAGLTVGTFSFFEINLANGNSFKPYIANRPGTSNYSEIGFNFHYQTFGDKGLIAYGGLSQPGTYPHAATPTAFAARDLINESVFSTIVNDSFGTGPAFREFYDIEYLSPDITNKYLAFKTSITAPNTAANYGWIKVNWNSTTKVFELLGAAYESEAGVAIMAGDTGAAAVPEPTTMAVFGLGALVLGAGKVRKQRAARRKKQAEALSV